MIKYYKIKPIDFLNPTTVWRFFENPLKHPEVYRNKPAGWVPSQSLNYRKAKEEVDEKK